jgi:hypothetical protein
MSLFPHAEKSKSKAKEDQVTFQGENKHPLGHQKLLIIAHSSLWLQGILSLL